MVIIYSIYSPNNYGLATVIFVKTYGQNYQYKEHQSTFNILNMAGSLRGGLLQGVMQDMMSSLFVRVCIWAREIWIIILSVGRTEILNVIYPSD